MKIEDLNKTQIVLLTLLVSFVTSIATGVVTVSLMEQAPQSVTQTINRVVERTIEKVTPAAVAGSGATVTKETTIVVKEDDLITKSIQTASQSVVAVRNHYVNAQGLIQDDFIGWGIVMNTDGAIVTDSNLIADNGSYTILTNDGVAFSTKTISQDETRRIAILSAIREKNNEAQKKYAFSAAKLGDSNSLNLGQSVIAIGGKNRKSVSVGVVTDLVTASTQTGTSTPEAKNIVTITASAMPGGGVTGGPLINNFGEVLGMSTALGLEAGSATYVPSIALKGAVAK